MNKVTLNVRYKESPLITNMVKVLARLPKCYSNITIEELQGEGYMVRFVNEGCDFNFVVPSAIIWELENKRVEDFKRYVVQMCCYHLKTKLGRILEGVK